MAGEVEKLLTPDDEETVTNLSGGGGCHKLYRMPEGERFGNNCRGLPAGIDIRGWGGYIILPPSNHRSGGVYQWELDYTPTDREPLPLPTGLIDILHNAQQQPTDLVAIKPNLPKPDLQFLSLPADIIEQITTTPEGDESAIDWATIRYLVRSWHDDDTIAAIWQHYPIGAAGKYSRRNQGNKYLARTIANARRETDRLNDYIGSADDYDGFGAPGAPKTRKPQVQYAVRDGQICYVTSTDDGPFYDPLADFDARIGQELTDEYGNVTYVITGTAQSGRKFEFEIEAARFEDGIKSALSAASPNDGIIPGRNSSHLARAIKKLSTDTVHRRRFNRTGWHDGQFLIPGREPEGTEIRLSEKTNAYDLSSTADIAQGTEALAALIDAVGDYGTVLVAYVLFPPLADLCGWRTMRYGLFMRGVTGSMKTTSARLAMAVWGNRFATDDTFEKVGAYGATNSAILENAAAAADLPFMIDNFKPNTLGRENVIGLIHGIMEGYTKARLKRSGEMAPVRPILSWPLMTGEDVPGSDVAALARLLIVDMESKRGNVPEGYDTAQQLANHLPSIGAAWLDLLERDGQRIAEIARTEFERSRTDFAEHIKLHSPSSENILRSATNLALNAAAWAALAELPALQSVVCSREGQHRRALYAIGSALGQHTADQLEAQKFLSALAELVSAGRVHLVHRDERGLVVNAPHGVPVVGWRDAEHICLLPAITRQQIDLLDKNLLGGLSMNAIYSQLESLELIAKRSTGQTTIAQRGLDGKSKKVLVLSAAALEPTETLDHEAIAQELGL